MTCRPLKIDPGNCAPHVHEYRPVLRFGRENSHLCTTFFCISSIWSSCWSWWQSRIKDLRDDDDDVSKWALADGNNGHVGSGLLSPDLSNYYTTDFPFSDSWLWWLYIYIVMKFVAYREKWALPRIAPLSAHGQLGPTLRHQESSLPQKGQLGPLVRHQKTSLPQKLNNIEQRQRRKKRSCKHPKIYPFELYPGLVSSPDPLAHESETENLSYPGPTLGHARRRPALA